MKNEILFRRIKKLVATERRIGVEILECLHQIEVRKAYAELRYDGLYSYCVRELGFTESQAYQRIQAMRALKEIPELAPKIESGALSVSSVAKVHCHYREERRKGVVRGKAEKLELFESLEGKTIREVETKLAQVRGEDIREKLVVEMDAELAGLWRAVNDLAAHRSGGRTSEVLKLLARDWLDRNDPVRKAGRSEGRKNGCGSQRMGDGNSERVSKTEDRIQERPLKIEDPVSNLPSETKNKMQDDAFVGSVESARTGVGFRRGEPWSTGVERSRVSRFIPAALKREVWRRDRGKCTRCESRHALEIDHRIPVALGGTSEKENLRLLCRSCNAFAAVQAFGARKIQVERSR